MTNNVKIKTISGELVKKARKENNLSLVQLNKLTGIDYGVLSKIENGIRAMSSKHLLPISKAVKISVNKLRSALISDKIIKEVEKYPELKKDILFMVNKKLENKRNEEAI